MPYDSEESLPENVKKNLPTHGRRIYKEAYNNAYDEYKDPDDRYGDASREEVAHKVAWSAVKNVYEKADGRWQRKE